METFLLYQHFRPAPEPSGGPLCRAHFWLHFLLQSCQPFKSAFPEGDQCLVRPLGMGGLGENQTPSDGTLQSHCPQVLVLEMNKVLLPARLEFQGTDPVETVTLSLLEPETQVNSCLSPLFHHCVPFSISRLLS